MQKSVTYVNTTGTLRLYAFIIGTGTRQVAKRECCITDIYKVYTEMIAEHQRKCKKQVYEYTMKFEC